MATKKTLLFEKINNSIAGQIGLHSLVPNHYLAGSCENLKKSANWIVPAE